MFNYIPNNLFGMVWLDIETNSSPGCSWAGHDAASSCQFVTDLINRVKSHGKNVGIYATAYMWQTIFGSRSACPSVASQQLWYAHYDGNPSFSDFSAFGGWSKPTIKQFQGTNTVCGVSLDKNFYPWSFIENEHHYCIISPHLDNEWCLYLWIWLHLFHLLSFFIC